MVTISSYNKSGTVIYLFEVIAAAKNLNNKDVYYWKHVGDLHTQLRVHPCRQSSITLTFNQI